MLYVTSRIEIGQPVDRVFKYVVDAATHCDWQADLIDAYVTPAGPVQIGSVYHYTSEVMGRQTHSMMRVTSIDENWRLMLTTATILNLVETAFHFEAIDGTTRLTMTTELKGGLIPAARDMVERHMRDLLEARLRRIKELLESGPG